MRYLPILISLVFLMGSCKVVRFEKKVYSKGYTSFWNKQYTGNTDSTTTLTNKDEHRAGKTNSVKTSDITETENDDMDMSSNEIAEMEPFIELTLLPVTDDLYPIEIRDKSTQPEIVNHIEIKEPVKINNSDKAVTSEKNSEHYARIVQMNKRSKLALLLVLLAFGGLFLSIFLPFLILLFLLVIPAAILAIKSYKEGKAITGNYGKELSKKEKKMLKFTKSLGIVAIVFTVIGLILTALLIGILIAFAL